MGTGTVGPDFKVVYEKDPNGEVQGPASRPSPGRFSRPAFPQKRKARTVSRAFLFEPVFRTWGCRMDREGSCQTRNPPAAIRTDCRGKRRGRAGTRPAKRRPAVVHTGSETTHHAHMPRLRSPHPASRGAWLTRPWARRTGGRTCCRTPRRRWGTSFRRGPPPRRALPSQACWLPARQSWPWTR